MIIQFGGYFVGCGSFVCLFVFHTWICLIFILSMSRHLKIIQTPKTWNHIFFVSSLLPHFSILSKPKTKPREASSPFNHAFPFPFLFSKKPTAFISRPSVSLYLSSSTIRTEFFYLFFLDIPLNLTNETKIFNPKSE